MNSFPNMREADFVTSMQRERRRAQLEDGVTIPRDPISVCIPDAIRMIGIGWSKLYELIKAREIETIKVGRLTCSPETLPV